MNLKKISDAKASMCLKNNVVNQIVKIWLKTDPGKTTK